MLRYILIALGVVVVLLVGAVFILPSLVPAEVYRAQIETRATEALGRPITIAGPVKVSVLPSLQARAGDVTIANADGFQADSFARVEELGARLALFPLLARRVEIREFVLTRPEISLEVNASGANNWTFASSAEAAQPAAAGGEFRRRPGAIPFDAALGDVRIVDGAARFIDRASGAEHAITGLNVALSMPGLAEPLAVDASFDLDGDPVSFKAKLDSLRSFFDGNASPLNVDLDAGVLVAAVDGQFEPGEAVAFSGDVRLASSDLKALAAKGGAVLPEGEIYRAFDVSGRASGSLERVAFENATIVFDDIRATGGFEADLSGAKPALSGRLSTGDLDVTPYMGAAGEGGSTASGGVPPWSEDPIDLSGLKAADASFTVEAASIRAGDLAFGHSLMTAALQNGRLQIDIQELEVYEGTGTARLVVDAGPATPTYALSADLANLQAQPFLAAAAKFDRLLGAGGGRLNLTAAGASQAAIMRSLDGTGGFDFKDGAIQGINIAAALRGVQEALQGNLSLDAFSSTASTDFTDLLGQFTINDGVATLSEFRLNSPLVRVTGSGSLDIGAQSLDLRLEPRAVASAEGQGGASDLAGVGIPLKLSGSWGSVTPGIDQDALQRIALQQASGAIAGDAGRALDDAIGDDAGALIRGALGLPGGSQPGSDAAPADGATTEGATTDDATTSSEEEEEDPAQRLLRGVFGGNN
jgi:AsmA protein